jgi:hypothetical protein
MLLEKQRERFMGAVQCFEYYFAIFTLNIKPIYYEKTIHTFSTNYRI